MTNSIRLFLLRTRSRFSSGSRRVGHFLNLVSVVWTATSLKVLVHFNNVLLFLSQTHGVRKTEQNINMLKSGSAPACAWVMAAMKLVLRLLEIA